MLGYKRESHFNELRAGKIRNADEIVDRFNALVDELNHNHRKMEHEFTNLERYSGAAGQQTINMIQSAVNSVGGGVALSGSNPTMAWWASSSRLSGSTMRYDEGKNKYSIGLTAAGWAADDLAWNGTDILGYFRVRNNGNGIGVSANANVDTPNQWMIGFGFNLHATSDSSGNYQICSDGSNISRGAGIFFHAYNSTLAMAGTMRFFIVGNSGTATRNVSYSNLNLASNSYEAMRIDGENGPVNKNKAWFYGAASANSNTHAIGLYNRGAFTSAYQSVTMTFNTFSETDWTVALAGRNATSGASTYGEFRMSVKGADPAVRLTVQAAGQPTFLIGYNDYFGAKLVVDEYTSKTRNVAEFYNQADTLGNESLMHIGGVQKESHYGVFIGARVEQSTPQVHRSSFIVKTNASTGVSHTTHLKVDADGVTWIGNSSAYETATITGSIFRIMHASGAYGVARETTNNVEAVIGADSAGAIFGSSTAHALLLRTNNTTRVDVAAASAVTRINVAAADTPTVAGQLQVYTAGAAYVTVRNATNDIETIIGDNATNSVVGTSTNHLLQILTNNTARMTIAAAAAEVGIGVTPASGSSLALASALLTTYGGTGLTSWTAGDLPYYATGTLLSKLAIGASGTILTSSGTAPQWSNLLSTVLPVIGAVTSEPTGFPHTNSTTPNSASTITFTAATRKFTIAPSSGSFTYYIKGTAYTISTTKEITITDAEDDHYIYLDTDSALHETTTWDYNLLSDYALVAEVHWSVDQAQAIYVSDERHGISMPWEVQKRYHATVGAAIESDGGLAPTGYTADGTGGDAVDCQIGWTGGAIWDDDLRHGIAADTVPTQIPILYKFGASGYWRKATTTDYAVIYTGSTADYAGTGMAYNLNTAGTWSLATVGNNQFGLMHYFATSDPNQPIIAVCGQATYATLALARAAAPDALASLISTGLPLVEFKSLWTFIFQYSSSYGNVPKTRIRKLDSTSDYFDHRYELGGAGGAAGAATDHGTLSGLADDDHLQYLLLATTRGTQTIASNVLFTGTVTSTPAAGEDLVGYTVTGLVGTVTNKGLNVATITTAASDTNYGIYIGAVSGASDNYAIYSAGGKVYFAGALSTNSTITAGGNVSSKDAFKITNGTYTFTFTPAAFTADRAVAIPNVAGTIITTGNLSSITAVSTSGDFVMNTLETSSYLLVGGIATFGSVSQLTGAFGAGEVEITKTSNGTLLLSRTSADTGGPTLEFLKRRSAWGVVNNGDRVGSIGWSAADSVDAANGAQIWAEVSAAPASNDMPMDIVFATSPDGSATVAEAMRITQAKDVKLQSTLTLKEISVPSDPASGYGLMYVDTAGFLHYVSDAGVDTYVHGVRYTIYSDHTVATSAAGNAAAAFVEYSQSNDTPTVKVRTTYYHRTGNMVLRVACLLKGDADNYGWATARLTVEGLSAADTDYNNTSSYVAKTAAVVVSGLTDGNIYYVTVSLYDAFASGATVYMKQVTLDVERYV